VTALEFHVLDTALWSDFEELFGPSGACGGCWCMWWRVKRSEFDAQHGTANKRALKRLVRKGRELGLLAYRGDRAVGWVAVEPRESYPVLGRSHVLKPVDDESVWSLTCLFVMKGERRSGVSLALVRAAAAHVKRCGGSWLEGYPVDPRSNSMADSHAFTGLASTFEKAGFREIARRSETRPIMRLAL